MRRATATIILILAMLSSCPAIGQSSIAGIPRIINYSKLTYKGGPQNWMITQTPNGFMYIANNDGLIEFDGKEWTNLKGLHVLNRSALYSNGRIYVGGFNTIGYFAPNSNGVLTYRKIALKSPKPFYFGEVWKIHELNGDVYFQSNEAIFRYNGKEIDIIKAPTRFDYSYIANNSLFINDASKGLQVLTHGKLKPIDPEHKIKTRQLSGVSMLDANRILISTIDKGLFVYDGRSIKEWDIPISNLLKKYQINTECKVNGYHAIGTILNGLYIIDSQGKTVMHINQEKGLSNNTILSIGKDSENNIWLGLNNGISKIEFNSSISYIGSSFNIESVYTTCLLNGNLYIGTNSGLYKIGWNRFLDPMKSGTDFKLIPNSEGQVWNLTTIGSTLFCGHNKGVFTVSGETVKEVAGIRGGWLFCPLNNDKTKILVGHYSGISIIEKKNNQWQLRNNITGFSESARFMEVDQNGDIWISHGYKGIYRLKLESDFTRCTSVKFYGQQSGLPSDRDNAIWRINGTIIVSTIKGIYTYNSATNKFTPNAYFNRIFSSSGWISYMKQDSYGNIWYYQNNQLAVLRLQEDGKYTKIVGPFYSLTNRNIVTFEQVYNLPNRTTLIGTEDGIAIYNPEQGKGNTGSFSVLVKDIVAGNERFSYSLTPNLNITIKHKNSPLNILAAVPFKNNEGVMYSFILEGFDNDWSAWSDNNHKEYTNLSEGSYVVRIKAKNINGEVQESEPRTITILPPWHRTVYAYIVYLIILLVAVAKIKKRYDNNIEKSRKRGEEKQKIEFKDREKQLMKEALESENEMIRVKNDTLQEVMKRKERELALSTMHIIQKNELINKMKAELLKLQSSTSEKSVKDKAADIIKKISKDIDNKSDWKIFEMHLEQVHEDFIKRLKDRFPELTSRELRLCVYLKMNMSSKEIATLMNISPRGVEISRYRVRKKLGLDRAEALSEILMEI